MSILLAIGKSHSDRVPLSPRRIGEGGGRPAQLSVNESGLEVASALSGIDRRADERRMDAAALHRSTLDLRL
jgi:hypothetical protein